MTERTATVIIVGAGPAGLVLGCLLRSAAIKTVIIEHRSRAHCVSGARAGFLAPNSVRILAEHGLAANLFRDHREHIVCEFRGDDVRFELAYDGLGSGEVHTVYPRHDLVRDLIGDYLDPVARSCSARLRSQSTM